MLPICKKYEDNPIWMGVDFNLPDVHWLSNNIIGHQYPKKLNEDFLDVFEHAKHTQIVEFSTRKNATLDLLFTFIVNCEPSPGFSDHDTSILGNIFCHPQKIKPVQRKINCWSRADIESLRTEVRNGITILLEPKLLKYQ